jgi:hypothetical protein
LDGVVIDPELRFACEGLFIFDAYGVLMDKAFYAFWTPPILWETLWQPFSAVKIVPEHFGNHFPL